MSPKFLPRPNPELYEINTAAWLFELSRKAGKKVHLGDVPAAEWDRLKSAGMDFVWLMGVWSRSPAGRKISLNDPGFKRIFDDITPGWTEEDVLGSSYAIDSHEPDPLIGNWDDIDHAREELHRRGMGLILDFIPNHTSLDHHWVTQHPEYYIQVGEPDYLKDPGDYFPVEYQGETLYIAHGRDPNFPSWTDTAQLNYFNPDTRQAMGQRLENLSQHCDGIRCDMAMLVLNEVFQRVWGWTRKNSDYPAPLEEFWSQAVRQAPDLIYIAEAYWDTEWTLQQWGFDFVYDKRFYDRVKSGYPHEVYLHLTAGLDYQSKLLRFIENHDELRSITAFGRGKAMAAAVLFSTLPGMRLFFQGQTTGRKIHLPVQIRRTRPEAADPDIRAFYNILLPAVNEDIFHHGTWKLREVFSEGDHTAENIIAYFWISGESIRLVAVNLDQHPSNGLVSLDDAVAENRQYSCDEILNGKNETHDGLHLNHPGFSLKLEGYQGQIWKIEPGDL
jgi:glycosidase